MAKAPQNQGLPWLAVVERVRDMCKDERFRMAAVVNLPNWREFCVVWTTAALGMRDAAIAVMCPNPNRSHESLMVWCWNTVDELVDAVLLIMDQRCTMSQHDIVTHFEVLRGAGLIYPDGTLHRLLRERMDREVLRQDATESSDMIRANLATAQNQVTLDAIIKTQAQGKKP